MSDPTPGVGRKIALGAATMIAGRFAIRGLSVVSTLILARLLTPQDFGLVALAAAAFVVADMLTATNYGLVLVRRAHVDRDLYDTAWTMNLLRCSLLGGLVAATAHWQAELLNEPRVAPVLMVIGLNVALDGLFSIGFARLQREFRFGPGVRHQVVGRVVAFVLTVVFAVMWETYWALVLGNLTAKLFTIPYSYWLAPHRPRLRLTHARELLGFSKWALALNACQIADGQGPNLVIGRFIGLHALGMQTSAYQIAATPVTELAVPIRAPIYSGYASALHDQGLLRRQYLDGLALLATVIVPLSVGIALVAPEVERVALGPQWVGAWVFIVFCALYALLDALSHFAHPLFTVQDRMARLVGLYAALMAIRVPAIILAAFGWGALGVLVAMAATAVLNFVVWQWAAGRLLGHGLGAALLRVWRPFVAAAVMAAAVLALRPHLAPADSSLLDALRLLGQLAPAGAAVHVAAALLLWRIAGAPAGPEQQILSFLGRARPQPA
ncbi:MAG: oligosaccharide flippase family protein [Acetobacteraceae bacterium]|nr:oligosaccharide flippase family protein [Acetobacteraceae bacterium]